MEKESSRRIKKDPLYFKFPENRYRGSEVKAGRKGS